MRNAPTGVERRFGPDELIVSKTDIAGRITYANEVFMRVSGFTEDELIGAPHSLIRHPDMPRSVFHFLWQRIQSGKEIFAYVINLAKGGDHYWVFAHVTPSFDEHAKIIGFHSNRRVPREKPLAVMSDLYGALRREEARHSDKASAVAAGTKLLVKSLESLGKSYDELMFAL
ncbi:MAG: PAS domain-containing protein [Myxococcales bacterium]|nr:PAS domain-containing protein [Myxococcales bacterium]